MYSMGWSILSVPVLKYFCSFASTAMELYIFCSAFHSVEIAVNNPNYKIFNILYLSFTCYIRIWVLILLIVHRQKSTVNFGLYSSNWTEMSIEFKKTLLLAMSMNSNHKQVIKGSPKSILNLEMFARVSVIKYLFIWYIYLIYLGKVRRFIVNVLIEPIFIVICF